MTRLLFSLRARMLMFVAVTMLPAILLAVFIVQHADRQQRRSAEDETLRLTLLVAQKQEEAIGGARRLMEILAALPATRGDDPDACRRLLASQIGDDSIYMAFAVFDQDGNIVCGARQDLAAGRHAGRAWFEAALAGRGFVVGHFSSIDQTHATLPLVLPLPERDDADRRVLLSELSLDALGTFLDEIAIPDNVGITLTDPDGVTLLHVPEGEIVPGEPYPVGALTGRPLESRVDVVKLTAPGVGETIYSLTEIADTRMRAIVRMKPKSLLRGLLTAEMWPLVALALAQMVIVLTLFAAGNRHLMRPIRALVDAAVRLSEGELSARSGLHPYGRDELARLAQVFDHMADSQQHRQEALEVRGERAEARLRAALWASETGTFHWDLRSNVLEYDHNLARLFGIAANESVESLEEFAARVHPEDRAHVLEAMRRCAQDGSDFDSEFRVVWPDGSVRWLDDKGKTFCDSTGRPISLTGACSDITERKRFEEQQRLLMSELNHRVKNMLATVQAVMVQTLRRSSSLDVFGEAFSGRLQALAHAHDLLTLGKWEAAELMDLVGQIVAPYGAPEGPEIRAHGPSIALRPKAALTLTLVLHELATNAAKYGALSRTGGSVALEWDVENDTHGRELVMTWREAGGPGVEPPTAHGFGITLIERSIGYELDGSAEVRFDPGGVVCVMRLPWEGNVLADDSSAATPRTAAG